MTHDSHRTNGIARQVHESLFAELVQAMALPKNTFTDRLLRSMFGKAALRFTRLAVELDRQVARQGIGAGARWLLKRFVAGVEARGIELIPEEGPLIIASNHPAAYDSIVISACVARPDYKIIIGEIPFLQRLPNVSRFGIYSPNPVDVYGRMQTVRSAIRHLQKNGALLIFPRGSIEPDPAFMPNPDAEFHHWSRSLEIFIKSVPETRVLITTVSGVIVERIFHHPITWLRKKRPDKQRLAFIYQFIRQMWSGRELFGLHPRVTFGELLQSQNTLAEIENAARRTMAIHLTM